MILPVAQQRRFSVCLTGVGGGDWTLALLVTSFLPSCENIIWATLFTANISADCPQFAAVNFPNPTSPPVCNLDIADRPGDNKVQDTTDTSCKRN